MKNIELIVPAGSLEVLNAAINFGADAIYFGPSNFSLRKGNQDFTKKKIEKAVKTIHKNNKKAFITLNSVVVNQDLEKIQDYIKFIAGLNIDGAIISDPGLIGFLQKQNIPIHLSTQMNILNYHTANFWKKQGAKRIILARELSLSQIKEICSRVNDIEFEVFVHGAMCISYSGRCLLSDYFTFRSANKGNCSHVCRWEYTLKEQKDNKEFIISEYNNKTYMLNSKDLCAIPILKEIINTGVKSLKIEGRNKGVHYVSVVTKCYRQAIDLIKNNKFTKEKREELEKILKTVSNRLYTTGFYKELKYGYAKQNYNENSYRRDYKLVGVVKEVLPNKRAVIDIKNRFDISQPINIFSPEKGLYLENAKINNIYSVDGKKETLIHANRVVIMEFPKKVSAGSLIRVKN